MTGITDAFGLLLKNIFTHKSLVPSVMGSANYNEKKNRCRTIPPRGRSANGCSQSPLHTTSRWKERSASFTFLIASSLISNSKERQKTSSSVIKSNMRKLYRRDAALNSSLAATRCSDIKIRGTVGQTPVVVQDSFLCQISRYKTYDPVNWTKPKRTLQTNNQINTPKGEWQLSKRQHAVAVF